LILIRPVFRALRSRHADVTLTVTGMDDEQQRFSGTVSAS